MAYLLCTPRLCEPEAAEADRQAADTERLTSLFIHELLRPPSPMACAATPRGRQRHLDAVHSRGGESEEEQPAAGGQGSGAVAPSQQERRESRDGVGRGGVRAPAGRTPPAVTTTPTAPAPVAVHRPLHLPALSKDVEPARRSPQPLLSPWRRPPGIGWTMPPIIETWINTKTQIENQEGASA